MDKQSKGALKQLKKEYLELEQIHRNEKECFMKIINTLGVVMNMHPEFDEEYNLLKNAIDINETLSMNMIKQEIADLRNKIFIAETRSGYGNDFSEEIKELNTRLLKSCRIIKHIVVALLDDFYPITDELKARADAIRIDCHTEMPGPELENSTNEFMDYLRELKIKISHDFKYIYKTFGVLLDHVKGLEKTLANEFNGDARQMEFEAFERQVTNEVGSIVDSFNIHATIDGIKSTVIEKLKKIKQLVATKKEEEIKKSRKAEESIKQLRKKIVKVEKDAQKMTKKVKHFQNAATKDGLTGLYNRYAFDIMIKDVIKAFNDGSEIFTIILLDMDNFKWINDTFGHVAGDKVLKRVARSLKDYFRENDFIARFGGDEFVVIVEGLNEKMARERFSRFKEHFKKKRFFSHNTGNVNVTISAGIAQPLPDENAEDLLNRADSDLYISKKAKPKIMHTSSEVQGVAQ